MSQGQQLDIACISLSLTMFVLVQYKWVRSSSWASHVRLAKFRGWNLLCKAQIPSYMSELNLGPSPKCPTPRSGWTIPKSTTTCLIISKLRWFQSWPAWVHDDDTSLVVTAPLERAFYDVIGRITAVKRVYHCANCPAGLLYSNHMVNLSPGGIWS